MLSSGRGAGGDHGVRRPANGRGRVRPELGAVQARRVALGLLVTGPLVGLTWIAAAAVAGLAVVVADLTLLAIITGQALTIPGSHTWAPVIVAAGASLTRVTLAGWAARRCLGIRAALTR
jgi:hypothetical protein